MPTFNYTSGNPNSLAGGQRAEMIDIAGPLDDVKTFLNGTIDATNLATAAKPVTVLGEYRTISEAWIPLVGSKIAATYFGSMSGDWRSGQDVGGNTAPMMTQITAANYAVSGLTTRLRLAATLATNATAPAVNFTYGLYPFTATGATSTDVAMTAGTVVTGSTVSRATPSASTVYYDTSSDFALPADGGYLLGVVTSGTTAANTYVAISLRLEVHHV